MIKINAAARLRATTLVKADWFQDLDKAGQDKYLADHPHSSRAHGGSGGLPAAKAHSKKMYNNFRANPKDKASQDAYSGASQAEGYEEDQLETQAEKDQKENNELKHKLRRAN